VTIGSDAMPPHRQPSSMAGDQLLAARLRIVWEDDDLVVVDKPSGMPSVPARTPLDPADVAAVLADRCGPLEAVHRLDRDTSGLLVLARSRAARAALGRAFEGSAVAKRYRAIVHGALPAREGVIHLPLGDDRDRPPRKRVDPILGRRATTRWRVCETRAVAGAAATGVAHLTATVADASLVNLEPVTGRSHQLRVHLAWLGCPILGDRLYGPHPRAAVPLALRAVSIVFPHPRTGHPVSLTAEPATGPPWNAFDAAAECWWPVDGGG
jgi:tRNA pseudouridine32 synthase/23S rRNA pseudouridine746 synthase